MYDDVYYPGKAVFNNTKIRYIVDQNKVVIILLDQEFLDFVGQNRLELEIDMANSYLKIIGYYPKAPIQ